MATIAAYISNRLRQIKAPDAKIFFIGFNRTGTTSCHHLMTRAGIRSVHWQDGEENIADGIEARLADHSELRGYLSRWTAYSDLISASDQRVIEGNRNFALFHQLFPDAYFVLNDRDVNEWLLSREQHGEQRFLRQSMAFHGTDQRGVIDIWRRLHADHISAVQGHFAGHPRFLHFRIDRDPVARLVDLLSPDYKVSASDWRIRNKKPLERGN